MRGILLATFALIMCKVSFAQTDSVKYHDSEMESQWGSSTSNEEYGCFVRFTPVSYPAQLTGVRGYFRKAGNNSTFRWKVVKDPAGAAAGGITPIYISPFTFMNPAAGDTTDQQHDYFTDLTSDSIMITSGDVYVGAVQTNDYFGMGVDSFPDDSVAVDRQWTWINVFGSNSWGTLASQMIIRGQLGITAYFAANTTGISDIKQENFTLYNSQSSNYKINQLENQITSFQLFDLSGRLLISEMITGTQEIDCSFLSPSLYLVRMKKIRN